MAASEKYATVLAVFEAHDAEKSGLIGRAMLADILREVSERSGPDVDEVMSVYCPGAEEQVDYKAFLGKIFGVATPAPAPLQETDKFPGLPGVDKEDLQVVFSCIDVKKNNVLEKAEVLQAVRGGGDGGQMLQELVRQLPALKPLLSVETWEATFQKLDTNGDGVITWFEFLHFFSLSNQADEPCPIKRTYSKGIPQSDLLAVFACLDGNGNGTLEKEEVLKSIRGEDSALKAFAEQVPSLRPLLRADMWEEAFKKLDTNKDGSISWFEFCKFFGSPWSPEGAGPTSPKAAGDVLMFKSAMAA